MSVPDPLPLRNIPVPAEVTAVQGCTCGGLEWHRAASNWWPPTSACAIWSLPPEQTQAAIAAARDRLAASTATLNDKLRNALGR